MIKQLAMIVGVLWPAGAAVAQSGNFQTLDPIFEKIMAERHIPGLVYGVVVDGKLAYVRSLGVHDVATGARVTPDTVFRIASMSKNFTALAALKLRDEGKLRFDDPAEAVIPELKRLSYPTSDSPRVTIRDLLSHTGGFVTDDPWGDRQLGMDEAAFSRFVAAGVPFSRSPGMAFEYSNFGYALAGRLVTNASGQNYADYIDAAFLKPLGMGATTFDLAKAPAVRRAIGYRWQDETWIEEPSLGPGAFGAMGGLMTTANDFARYVAWELAAWPPRDGPEDGILRRSSVREIARPMTYAASVPQPAAGCDLIRSYGMGTIPFSDCVLGAHFGHSGGLPGYGSNVLMLPERGLGVFAFANLTYAPMSIPVREAATALVKSGAFPFRQPSPPLIAHLTVAASHIAAIYAAGDIEAVRGSLAMNVLLDRDAARRNAELKTLKARLGTCRAVEPIVTSTAMSGLLSFPCASGTLRARVTLAPTTPVSFQTFELAAAP